MTHSLFQAGTQALVLTLWAHRSQAKTALLPTLVVEGRLLWPNGQDIFLRAKRCCKDGNEHQHWSLLEDRSAAGAVWFSGGCGIRRRATKRYGRPGAKASGCSAARVPRSQPLALSAVDRPAPELAWEVVSIRVSGRRASEFYVACAVRRPRRDRLCCVAVRPGRAAHASFFTTSGGVWKNPVQRGAMRTQPLKRRCTGMSARRALQEIHKL